MLKIIPIIMSAVALFSAGSIPLKDIGNLVPQDGGVVYEAVETQDAVKPFVKQPRVEQNAGKDNFVIAGEENKTETTVTERNETKPTETDKTNVVEAQNGNKATDFDADEIFERRKNDLNARFAKMFELKNRLDEINKESESLWQEYYAMRESYDREYKHLVREWARNNR